MPRGFYGLVLLIFLWTSCQVSSAPIPSCVPRVVNKSRRVSPSALFQGHRFSARCCSSNPVCGAAGCPGSSGIYTGKNSPWWGWNTWSWKRPPPPHSCRARCSRSVRGVGAVGAVEGGKGWAVDNPFLKNPAIPTRDLGAVAGSRAIWNNQICTLSAQRELNVLRDSFITCHKESPAFSPTKLGYRPGRNLFSSASFPAEQVSSAPSPRSFQVGHIQGARVPGFIPCGGSGKASCPVRECTSLGCCCLTLHCRHSWSLGASL